MAPSNIVLIECGAFNPPTIMHLRMFEIARDHLQRTCYHTVIGGIISPVHDGYGKKDLESATHRCNMTRLALQSSDWIRLSEWECHQDTWSRTKVVMQYHQNQLNSILTMNDTPNKRQRRDELHWIPDDMTRKAEGPVQVKLLCGGDLLESFGTPGLWADEDIETIVGQHGLVVITRNGSNPYKFIYESDILTKYQNNIHIVTEWITNDVSSTKIRRALRRSESVKYLLVDPVIDYIHKQGLYNTKETKYLFANNTQNCFLTPSPSDVNMESPSPTYTDMERTNFVPNGLVPTFIRVERSEESVSNEENARKSGNMGYPGQAVQIIATNRKVSSDEQPIAEEPVANVQIQITKDGIKVISDKETTV